MLSVHSCLKLYANTVTTPTSLAFIALSISVTALDDKLQAALLMRIIEEHDAQALK